MHKNSLQIFLFSSKFCFPSNAYKSHRAALTHSYRDYSSLFFLDDEKPRLRCPKNLVIESDVDTKVTWGEGVFTDNIGVGGIVFNPPNGSVFESNKYHRVEATVTDVNGNNDTCVMEVYVKGWSQAFCLLVCLCRESRKSIIQESSRNFLPVKHSALKVYNASE